MKPPFHVWNLIQFKGQKYGLPGLFYFCMVKRQSRRVLSSVLISRLSMILGVNVVLNRTVVVDSD